MDWQVRKYPAEIPLPRTLPSLIYECFLISSAEISFKRGLQCNLHILCHSVLLLSACTEPRHVAGGATDCFSASEASFRLGNDSHCGVEMCFSPAFFNYILDVPEHPVCFPKPS